MRIKKLLVSDTARKLFAVSKTAFTYISVFILFFLDSGFFAVNNISGTVKLLLNTAAIIMLVLAFGAILRLRKRLLAFYLLFVAVATVSGIVHLNIKQTLIIVICITMGMAVANLLSYESFKKIYVRMMLFIALFSLVTLFLWLVFPAVIRLLPTVIKESTVHYNAVFSIISSSTYSTRNYGMFWEPGAFAIFLNIAFLFEMTDRKQSLWKMMIFATAIVSTLSTLGIICLANLVAVYLFNNKGGIRNYKRNRAVLLLASIAAGIYLLCYNEEFVFHVFGKLTDTDKGLNSSTATRINAIIYPFKAFASSPLIGIGYNDFLKLSSEYCSDMPTCTFLNWLAIYGIFGLPFCIGCIRFFLKKGTSLISRIGLFVFSLLVFSTENFLQIGFIYILVFYGIVGSRRKKRASFSKAQP